MLLRTLIQVLLRKFAVYWAVKDILRYLEVEKVFQGKESKNEHRLHACLILQRDVKYLGQNELHSPTVPFFLCVLDYLVVTLDRLVSRYKYNGKHSIGHDRSD